MKYFQLILIPLAAFALVFHAMSPTVSGEEINGQDGGKYYTLLMPNIQPLKQDVILCTGFQVPNNDYEYILEFTPNTSMHSNIRMSLYGCELAGRVQEDNPRTVWDCDDPSGPQSQFPNGPVCASSGKQILYSWTKDASPFRLPEGVAFKIGKGTGINYLVLRIYYPDVDEFLRGGTDNSGVTITVLPSSTNRITKKAGIYLLSSDGVIRSGQEEHFESACRINKAVEMHPFAFRTHTHALGKVAAAYKVDKYGNWQLIGKGNPQQPQNFYPVKDDEPVIVDGDIVASRCTMYNFRDRDIYIGNTNHDEMCVFYVMYYVDDDKPLLYENCHSSGPPSYYWSKDPKLQPVPSYIDKEASEL